MSLQEAGIEICTVVKLYESLLSYFQAIQNNFDDYETQAKELVSSDYIQSSCRKRTRNIMFDEGATPEVEMNPLDTFGTQTFYVIVDKLIIEMGKRKEAYARVNEKFSFLRDRKLTEVEIKAKAINLVQSYPSDLEGDFVDEFLLFSQIYHETTVCEMLQSQIRDKLINSFPNVNVSMRIYLAILRTSCEGERSFSKLKVVKNSI